MRTTVVALFDEYAEAEHALNELREAGFNEGSMSLVGNAQSCPVPFADLESRGPKVGKGVLTGAAAGGAGLAALAIPGIGPVVALGPLAAGLLGAGVGGVAGGILAALTDNGVSKEDANCLCEAIRRGGTVVAVSAEDEQSERAADILGRHRLVDLEECHTDWTASGWKGFDPAGEPVSPRPTAAPATPLKGLPFDPSSISPRSRQERRQQRAVRQYVRVR